MQRRGVVFMGGGKGGGGPHAGARGIRVWGHFRHCKVPVLAERRVYRDRGSVCESLSTSGGTRMLKLLSERTWRVS